MRVAANETLEVESERAKLLYAQVPTSLIVNLVNISVTILLLKSTVPAALLLTWAGGLRITLALYALLVIYDNRPPHVEGKLTILGVGRSAPPHPQIGISCHRVFFQPVKISVVNH